MQFVVHDGDQVFVEDFLLLVRHGQEALVDGVQLLLGKLVSELVQPVAQSGPARARGQHHAAFGKAHVFRAHDLVGLAVFQESVHVDAGAVRERVGADHGFVGGNRHAEQSATRRLVR